MERAKTIVPFLMVAASLLIAPIAATANPYLAKPGEAPVAIKIGTCAIAGGSIHLYTALDNNLFEKYGLKLAHVGIRGSSPSLAALAADEIQFLYCSGDATMPGMASGIDVKLIATPLVGQPWVLLAHKEIKRPEDLKGKAIGTSRPGQLTYRLAKAFVKKFNLEHEVQIRPVGEGQMDLYQAMVAGIVQACPVTAPLDVQGKKEGFNVIFNMNDLDPLALSSSLHTNAKMLKERPAIVQKVVAALAESVYFVEKNPDKAKASVGKALKLSDPDSLQSAYDAFAKALVNRRMVVPADAVAEAIEVARETGAIVKRKPDDIFDNAFTEHLEKSGFLKELWGDDLPRGK